MLEQKEPGNLYIEGLRAIAERDGVSIEKAAEIVEQDLRRVGGLEHLSPTRKALNWLKDREGINQAREQGL